MQNHKYNLNFKFVIFNIKYFIQAFYLLTNLKYIQP